MSKKPHSTGTCCYCKSTFTKSGMSKHLEACPERQEWLQHGERQKQLARSRILHLIVEGYEQPQYWMHLELPAAMTLAKLDGYLRQVWLECCGHLSAFYIANETYGVRADAEMGFKSMRAKLGDLVQPGDWFGYDYDFGTTTTLRLGVLGEREGVLAKDRIEPMAINDPPDLRCACGEPATKVCTQCLFETDDCWFCDNCATEHECDEEMLLPNVNSPRVGMCAYGLEYDQ